MSVTLVSILADLLLLIASLVMASLLVWPRLRNSNGKGLLTGALSSGLLCIALFVLVVPHEQVFIFNPRIDTVYAAGFTPAKFSRVQAGMAKPDVVNILGEPFEINRFYSSGEEPSNGTPAFVMNYSRDGGSQWGDFAWELKGVALDRNERVMYTYTTMIED